MKTIKLIDYLDISTRIKHADGRRVVALHYSLDWAEHTRIKVDFEDGSTIGYPPDSTCFYPVSNYESGEDQTQPLKPHDFEEGIRYQFREHEGWAKFVIYIPEAIEDERLVFITDLGDVITRCITGGCHMNTNSSDDIIPKEYEDPAYEYWINVYPNHTSEGHRSRNKADKAAGSNRIDCVCIKRGRP